MSENLKQVIKREYLKCVEDPVHFMRKYCTIQHPQRRKVKFDLYPFQEKCLTEFKENRYSIILKSRQLGISTLSAGYALWTMLFKADKKDFSSKWGKGTLTITAFSILSLRYLNWLILLYLYLCLTVHEVIINFFINLF